MIWAWSWTSRTVWSCSTTARRSATACPTRSRPTRRSSTPISASATSGARMGPFLETLIGGLLTGVLYSLVALGFVLIFKASGVFNFAQGAMVLFAALTLARLADKIDDKELFLAHFVVVA